MNKITISAIAVVAGLLALFLAKNSIQTTLFDRSKFLDCFEAEVISEYQMQSIRSGQQTAGIFESMLKPQLRSSANQTVDFVKKNGLADVLERAKRDVDKLTDSRLEKLQSEGELPEKETYLILSEAEEVCLERQTIW
mgnify:CR=1 FL=1